jgi:16S rRNA (adenine(1408)-N(1))-methyltransferase
MFLATDANPDALLQTASRAARKPPRGGVPNLICIAEPLDVIADDLAGAADRVTVILPWGSLLRALVLPEIASLTHLRRLCALNASVEIVFSYDNKRDASARGPLGAFSVQEPHVRHVLPELYERAGFRVTSVEGISEHELGMYETTWAKRLAFGQRREIWRLRAIANEVPDHGIGSEADLAVEPS